MCLLIQKGSFVRLSGLNRRVQSDTGTTDPLVNNSDLQQKTTERGAEKHSEIHPKCQQTEGLICYQETINLPMYLQVFKQGI